MLVNRYKPKKIEEIVGHKMAIQQIVNYISDYKKGKALLIHGSTGIGKTLMSQVLSKDNKMMLTEIHSSEISEIKKIKSSSRMTSLMGSKRIILIDEVDNFSDRNTVSELIDIIKVSKFPIILTADNAYDRKLKKLRDQCEIMQLRRLSSYSMIKRLREICDNEGVTAAEDVLKLISENSHGDMRSAINDLQILSANRKTITEADVVGFRERQMNVFDALKIIFKSNDLNEARRAIWYCDKDLEELFWWIEHNITNEFKDPEQIALAYEILSRADMFNAKIRDGRDWEMLKYISGLLASITLIRGSKDNHYTAYKPPGRLIMLAKSKAQRTEDDETFGDLGKQLHCSKRCIKNQMPFLNIITSD